MLPEDDAQDDRRRIEGDAKRQATLNEEDDADERSGLHVEPLFQVLVGGVHLRTVEQRHGGVRQDHHRQGQTEIELHEPHAVHVRLAG